jgi:hypothetical protein
MYCGVDFGVLHRFLVGELHNLQRFRIKRYNIATS